MTHITHIGRRTVTSAAWLAAGVRELAAALAALAVDIFRDFRDLAAEMAGGDIR